MQRSAISFAESALNDLLAIKDRYAEQGAAEVGVTLIAEIFERIEALADHPDMGRVVPEFDQPLLRELIHHAFRIVYRRGQNRIRVVRVWRSERLPRLSSDDEM